MLTSTAASSAAAASYIAHTDILAANGIDVTWQFAAACMFATFVVFRVLGYVCLRYLHKPMAK